MNKKYTFKNMRISILANDIIRFEYAPDNIYSNGETLFTAEKKEIPFELVEKETGYQYQDYLISFDKLDPLNTLKIYKDGKIIYRYKFLRNTGELPLPNKTPYIFPLMDTPRVLIPEYGYDKDSNFIYEKNNKDLYLLICKGDYKLLRKQYISLTGTNDLPRLNNFGLFHSRYYPYSEKSAKEMILKYKKHHIPLDNFVLDTDWRESLKTKGVGYKVNENLFPNISNFYHFAHNNGIEVIMNDHPLPVNRKVNVLSNEEIAYRKEQLTKFFVLGLDSWWYDRNWIVSLKSISKRIPVESLARYAYHDITKQFYQGLVLDPEVYVRPVTMSNITEIRNGNYVSLLDSRSHIYPFQWSGDIAPDSSQLMQEIKNMNRCANNMLSYYSSDIGGHISDPTRDDFIRWYQYGVFSPILRPHCTCDVKYFREPWAYGEKAFEIIKEYIYMRYHLMNVIYTNAYKNFHHGLGIFRPLYLNYPNDKKVYKEDLSYSLGDNILIAPICGKEAKNASEFYVGKASASFYLGREIKGEAILKKRLKDINFYVNGKSLYKSLPKYDFSARYKLKLKFNHDVDLYIRNDDGVKVFINNQLTLKDWNCHSLTNNFVKTLKKGITYKIRIDYFQAGYDAALQLLYIPHTSNKKTKIYLPAGEWYNVAHRNVYQGNRYIKEKYRLNETPLFVKAGSLLPLYKNVENLAKASLKNIVYDYYPSRKIETNDYFFEDDGLTTGYKVGVYRKNRYSCKFIDDHYEVVLYKSENNLDDHLDIRNVLFKMHVRDLEKVIKVEINDTPISFKRHDHNSKVYPFNTTEWSKDSKTCCFKFRQDIKKDYIIKMYIA